MPTKRRGTPDFLLLLLTLVLVAIGLLMVFSASSMVSTYKMGDSLFYTKRQALSIVLGVIGMLFFMNLPLAKLKKWAPILFVIVLLLLVIVLFIGNAQFGARSWIDLGPLNLQPSEFAKLAVVLYLAALIVKKGDKIRDLKKGLIPCLVIVGLVMFLIMLEPDLGSCVILVLGAMIVIIAGGANLKHIFTLGIGGVVLASIYLLLPLLLHPGIENYRLKRFTTLFNPWTDPSGSGYQMIQSLYAFGHGGLTGTGLGKSIQKLHFLTQPHSDFIFAIIGEELGFLGTAVFIAVYSLFIWRGIVVSLRSPDTFASMAGVGIMGMIGVQALINVGGVTNSIPMTGVTLPLISYGGSSILATLLGMGIVLGISREQKKSA